MLVSLLVVGCASDCEQQLPQSQERRISVREDRTLWDRALHGGHAVVSRVAYLLLGTVPCTAGCLEVPILYTLDVSKTYTWDSCDYTVLGLFPVFPPVEKDLVKVL